MKELRFPYIKLIKNQNPFIDCILVNAFGGYYQSIYSGSYRLLGSDRILAFYEDVISSRGICNHFKG